MKLKDLTFVVFDTETTGLSEDSHIVEIGAVKIRDGRILDKYSQIVRPPLPIPPDVVGIHGITNEMVRDAPCFVEAFERFLKFIRNAFLVAHNAPFDIKILAHNIAKAEKPLPDNPVLDTCRIAKSLFPNLPSYSLKYLARYWNSPFRGFHRALADAMHTSYIFLSVLEKCGLGGDSSVDEMLQVMGPPIYFRQFAPKEPMKEPKDLKGKLVRAIERGKMLDIVYENGMELKRRVIPLNLFSKHNRWYLRATCLIDDREKTFRLDRIKQARIVE